MFDIETAGLLPMIAGRRAGDSDDDLRDARGGRHGRFSLMNTPGPTRCRPASSARRSTIWPGAFDCFGLFAWDFSCFHRRRHRPPVLWRGDRLGQGALIWASLTMATLTLPVVIVTTEEALSAVPRDHREASYALGATRLQTIGRVVLPRALPGIRRAGFSRSDAGAGEVAPILFTGAVFYMRGLPRFLTDKFMQPRYHTFILSTQSPNIDQTRPVAHATVLTLLVLTVALNAAATLLRAHMQRKKPS
jgi:ABC-type phosphate transport system permease subunit